MSNLLISIFSRRHNRLFTIKRFTEYSIDTDLETDADIFNITIANPGGIYSGIFCKFDSFDIKLNNVGIMNGIIDDVTYESNDSGNLIRIAGRDIAIHLVENDALPSTLQNVKPSTYIENKCKKYGIKYSVNKSSKVCEKLIIGTGESEISIMNNILMDSRHRLWCIYDTLYTGEWNTGSKPLYQFVRGSGLQGIPFKTLSLKESGADTKSEVRIYGSTNDGEEKTVGVAKNDWMINNGIIRVSTRRSSNDDSASKYASNALRDVRDSFKENQVLVITFPTMDTTILPNVVARVIDAVTGIDASFFVKGVNYSKDIGSGSITTLTMIPGDTTFDVLWQNQGNGNSITAFKRVSLDELMKQYKG